MADTDRRDAVWPETAPRQRRRFPWSRVEPRERRRARWLEFRDAYPRILTAMALGLVFLIAFDGVLLFKAVQYKRQIGEDRAAMSTTDKQRADALLASQSSRASRVGQTCRVGQTSWVS